MKASRVNGEKSQNHEGKNAEFSTKKDIEGSALKLPGFIAICFQVR
jgi:hypothetical protein